MFKIPSLGIFKQDRGHAQRTARDPGGTVREMKRLLITPLFLLIMMLAATATAQLPAGAKMSITDVKTYRVTAKAIVPRGLPNPRLKAIALKAIDEVKRTYPAQGWIQVWLADDERMYRTGNYIAFAELKDGKAMVRGGIPPEAEIADLQKSGLNIVKPTDQGMNIIVEFTKIKEAAQEKGKILPEGEIYSALSKKFKLPPEKIQEIHYGIGWYYLYNRETEL